MHLNGKKIVIFIYICMMESDEVSLLETRLAELQKGSTTALQRSAVLRKIQESRVTDDAIASHIEEVRQWRLERDREEEQRVLQKTMKESRESEEAAIRAKLLLKGTPEGRLREKELELMQRQAALSKASEQHVAARVVHENSKEFRMIEMSRQMSITDIKSSGISAAERILEEVKRERAQQNAALWLQHAQERYQVDTKKLEFESVLQQRAAVAQALKDCEQSFWEYQVQTEWTRVQQLKEIAHEAKLRLELQHAQEARFEAVRTASEFSEISLRYFEMSRHFADMSRQALDNPPHLTHFEMLCRVAEVQNHEKGKLFPGLAHCVEATIYPSPMTPLPMPQMNRSRGKDAETQTPTAVKEKDKKK
eukprot:PhF_6_TR1483/c0_g1_i1/m.2674